MSGYQEYPKMMTHPQAQPAVVAHVFRMGYKPQTGETETSGQPARYQPVTVNSAAQQGEYESKGYVSATSDVSGFNEAMSGKPAHYHYDEYPKWVDVAGEPMLFHTQEQEHATLGYNDVLAKPEMEIKNKGGRPRKVEA